MNFEYDLFIAYHGSNNPKGSLAKAEEIYSYLTERGVKVFLFSHNANKDIFATPQMAQVSHKFLLVANGTISTDKLGYLSSKYILQEIRSYEALYYRGDVLEGDKRVYCYDGLTSEKGSQLNPAFNNVPNFENNSLEDIYKWVIK